MRRLDTITVETNTREKINKNMRKKYHARSKIKITELVVAIDILNANKRILNYQPFLHKVYGKVEIYIERSNIIVA